MMYTNLGRDQCRGENTQDLSAKQYRGCGAGEGKEPVKSRASPAMRLTVQVSGQGVGRRGWRVRHIPSKESLMQNKQRD